jgi:hypothetical protein
LVSAISDQSTGTEWGCPSTDLPNVPNVLHNSGDPYGFGAEIGDGHMDTDSIVVNTCIISGDAANVCFNLSLNGYDDWFLPSILELDEMRINLHLSGFGNFYTGSTEY